MTVRLRLSGAFKSKTSAGNWKLDIAQLCSAITLRTKALILNTPHNPTGKVFSWQELQDIAAVAIKHNLLVISDQVVAKLAASL